MAAGDQMKHHAGESPKASREKATSTTTTEATKAASSAPPVSNVSFVAFDGAGTDATRRAVRKQAALASAAARKATIAKKIAKQQSSAGGGSGDGGGGRKDNALSTTSMPVNVKRKRSTEHVNTRKMGVWQHGLIVDMTESYGSSGRGDAEYQSDSSGTRGSISRASSSATSYSSQSSMMHVRAGSPVRSPPASKLTETSTTRPIARAVPADLASGSFADVVAVLSSRAVAAPDLGPRQGKTSSDRTYQQLGRQRGEWPIMADDLHAYEEPLHLPLTPESMAEPKSRSSSVMDPFNSWPVEYHPIYDRVLYHMMNIYAPLGWPALGITNTEGRRWEHFMMQHSLAEPALFLVRVLYASGDLINSGQLSPEVAVHLRSLAINTINEALQDGERSISDGLILAVGRIALTEVLYGDQHVAHTIHRPAHRRMITLRGGMAALPFPPLVKRLMRWADKVMSVQGGTPRFLPDAEDQGNTTYSMDQSVSVLDSWAPAAGHAIRQKIAVSDLIS